MDIEIGDPELDGIGLLQQIRAIPSYVQVCAIAISSHKDDEYEAQIKSAGFNAFFSKPVARVPLLAEIARLLN
jgi:CheY-like chemotaxis protein